MNNIKSFLLYTYNNGYENIKDTHITSGLDTKHILIGRSKRESSQKYTFLTEKTYIRDKIHYIKYPKRE